MSEEQNPYDHPIFESVESLREAVLKVCDTYPDSRNAILDNGCVYDDGLGNHCVFGQLFVDNGLPMPEGNPSVGSILRSAGNAHDVIDFANDCQGIADAALAVVDEENQALQRTWAEVAAVIRGKTNHEDDI